MQTLTKTFKKEFSIKEVINSFDDSGQKIVYIVRDLKGEKLAMKMFRNCSERDVQEIEILKRFESLAGIPKVIRVEEYQGDPLLFEEFIDGPDLEDVKDRYLNKVDQVSTLLKDIAVILKPVWEKRIVHRDLKPKNIKIVDSGKPIIIDFGIARDLSAESITQTGNAQPMTWSYASPEQFAGDKRSISYRTDFFALGLIGYQLFYGSHPFGKNKEEIATKFENEDNKISLEDNQLKSFFEFTLAINPSGRVRSPAQLIKLL